MLNCDLQTPSTLAGAVSTDTGAVILRNYDDLDCIREDWLRLWSQTPAREVFHTFSWARSWSRAFGTGYRLFTPVVHIGPATAGIFPLVLHGRTLKFLGHDVCDYNNFLAAPESYADALLCAFELLFEKAGEWDECVLDNISDRSLLYKTLAQLPHNLRKRFTVQPSSICPALVLDKDKDELLDELVRKDSLKRHRKKLQKLGPVTFQHLDSAAECAAHYPTFVDQHIARRYLAGHRSAFLSPNYVRFYQLLMQEFQSQGILRFSSLQVQGRPAAYHLGFEIDSKYIWYLPTFDASLWDFGPGEVLLQSILQYIAGSDVNELDFTRGDEAFKTRFSNTTRLNYCLRISAPSLRGFVSGGLAQARAKVSSKPRLRSALKLMIASWSRLSQGLRREGPAWPMRGLRRLSNKYIYEAHRLSLYTLPPGANQPKNIPAHLQLRPLNLLELGGIAHRYSDWLTPDVLHQYRQRLKRGELGFTAFAANELVCTSWVGARKEISIDGHCIPLSPPGFLIYDCQIHSKNRDAVRAPDIVAALAGICHQQGQTAWTICDSRNAECGHGFEAAGLILQGCFRLRRILGRSRLRPYEN